MPGHAADYFWNWKRDTFFRGQLEFSDLKRI